VVVADMSACDFSPPPPQTRTFLHVPYPNTQTRKHTLATAATPGAHESGNRLTHLTTATWPPTAATAATLAHGANVLRGWPNISPSPLPAAVAHRSRARVTRVYDLSRKNAGPPPHTHTSITNKLDWLSNQLDLRMPPPFIAKTACTSPYTTGTLTLLLLSTVLPLQLCCAGNRDIRGAPQACMWRGRISGKGSKVATPSAQL
jgi:hypothetical protein